MPVASLGSVCARSRAAFAIRAAAPAVTLVTPADRPHGRAIRPARIEGWFTEELYARFRLLGIEGAGMGKNPLAARKDLEREAA